MKLELAILAGDESKKFLANLTKVVERMEAAVVKYNPKASVTATTTDEEEETADASGTEEFTSSRTTRASKRASQSFGDEYTEEGDAEANAEIEEELTPTRKTKGKKAASFDDETSTDVEEQAPAPKAKKAPKLTIKDVNAACLERAGQTSRKEVLTLLQKKFGVKSVTELDPETYATVIKTMKAN